MQTRLGVSRGVPIRVTSQSQRPELKSMALATTPPNGQRSPAFEPCLTFSRKPTNGLRGAIRSHVARHAHVAVSHGVVSPFCGSQSSARSILLLPERPFPGLRHDAFLVQRLFPELRRAAARTREMVPEAQRAPNMTEQRRPGTREAPTIPKKVTKVCYTRTRFPKPLSGLMCLTACACESCRGFKESQHGADVGRFRCACLGSISFGGVLW